ncbi:MAG: GAF domain-containing protein, partial [Deltaproteobacteria bacterium]|nr:GAF domain-containing protein [Deltaproteobacteria bacterium]
MATLLVQLPGSPAQPFPLVKPLTSLGGSADADLRLPDVRGVIAIEFDGKAFSATALDGATLNVNGKKRDQIVLSDGDLLALGRANIVFRSSDRIPTPVEVARVPTTNGQPEPAALALSALTRLQDLLARESNAMQALALLLDGLIESVKADRGFLLVVEEGAPRVEVARNFQKQDIANAVERLSDSIVAKVLQTREPLIVSDALTDREFSASASVISLKLSSVMCIPLIRRGDLFGVVYLGNDKLANLFTQRELTLARALCGAATLALESAVERDELRAKNTRLVQQLEEQQFGDIVGSCDSMKDIFRKVDKV